MVAPLLAAVLFASSGFLAALEHTTEAGADLAEASESAPEETQDAVESVESLPEVAELTGRQADALVALADALEGSAARVAALNDSLAAQVEGLDEQVESIRGIHSPIKCIEDRLGALLDATRTVPGAFGAIGSALDDLKDAQNKSIRHLRSINRKLAALGVVGEAGGAQPPPPPGRAPAPDPAPAPGPRDC
ncbi:MAG: hypothetical protein ACRDK3_08600 [Actinomycetota bacterium]